MGMIGILVFVSFFDEAGRVGTGGTTKLECPPGNDNNGDLGFGGSVI